MRRFNILNLILGTLVAFLSINSYRVWSKPYVRSTESKSSLLSGINSGQAYIAALTNTDEVFPTYYDAVTQKNLFRPQRAEYKPPPPPPPAPPAPKVKVKKDYVVPDIRLRGVILLDDGRRVAIIEGSYTKFKNVEVIKQQVSGAPTKKTRKVQEIKKIIDKRVYVGDIIGSFTLIDIKEDRIILEDDYKNKLEFVLGKKEAEGEGEEKKKKQEEDKQFIKAGENNKVPKDSKVRLENDTLIVDIISYDGNDSDSGSESTSSTSSSSNSSKTIKTTGSNKGGSNQSVDAYGISNEKHVSGAKSGRNSHLSGN